MIEIFYADKSEIKIDLKEVFYYLGYKSAEPKGRERQLIESTVEEIWKNLSCKACFDSFRFLVFQGGVLDFGFAKVQSESLEKALAGCKEAIIFTATVGFEVDRIIQRYSVLSPSKAAAAQAAGAAAIEAFCDLLCKNFSITKKADLHPRFSAGYGDLPLSFQKDIFLALDCERKIGVTLTQGFMMLPSKSVSAIVGATK